MTTKATDPRYPDGPVSMDARRLTFGDGATMDVLALTDTESGRRMFLNGSELRELADFIDGKTPIRLYLPPTSDESIAG